LEKKNKKKKKYNIIKKKKKKKKGVLTFLGQKHEKNKKSGGEVGKKLKDTFRRFFYLFL